MATVKIHEGTKIETSLDLQDDEGVIFVSPEKNKLWRFVPLGCFKGNKNRQVNLVITSKRVITVPTPPNKKNYEVESFYWKDIAKAREIAMSTKEDAAKFADFAINMNPGQTSSSSEGGTFRMYMKMSLGNVLKAMSAWNSEVDAKNASVYGASLRMAKGEDYVYTKASLDKYYANMAKQAQERAKSLDFSKADHNQTRDYIVALINDCVEEANAG